MSRSAVASAAAKVAAALLETCEGCGSKGDSRSMLRCSGCRLFCYCKVSCQKEDWKARHRHVCATHKTAAQDAKFAQLPGPVRLELLVARVLLSVSSDQPQVKLDIPDALAAQWPALACRWLDQTALSASLGARDGAAYTDMAWESERLLLDVRVAALWALWRHRWLPALQKARQIVRLGGNPLAPLLVLQSISYAKFLHVPKTPGTPAWRLRFSDAVLLQATAEVRSLYCQFYLELALELRDIALQLMNVSWTQQLQLRLAWQRHADIKAAAKEAGANSSTEKYVHSDSNSGAASFDHDDVVVPGSTTPEEGNNQAAAAALEIERDRIARDSSVELTSMSSSQCVSLLSLHAFYCLLNAAAAGDSKSDFRVATDQSADSVPKICASMRAVRLANEIIARRGFWPRTQLRVLLTSKSRLEPCLLLLAIITHRFMAELQAHGLKSGSAADSILIDELRECGFNSATDVLQQCEPRSHVTAEPHKTCRWCDWEWDESKLGRCTMVLLFLVRLLPLKHASTWKEAEAVRKYLFSLAQHGMRQGIAWMKKHYQWDLNRSDDFQSDPLRPQSQTQPDRSSSDSDDPPTSLSSMVVGNAAAHTDNSALSRHYRSRRLSFARFANLCTQLSEISESMDRIKFWHLALSFNPDYWTLFDMSMLLAAPLPLLHPIFTNSEQDLTARTNQAATLSAMFMRLARHPVASAATKSDMACPHLWSDFTVIGREFMVNAEGRCRMPGCGKFPEHHQPGAITPVAVESRIAQSWISAHALPSDGTRFAETATDDIRSFDDAAKKLVRCWAAKEPLPTTSREAASKYICGDLISAIEKFSIPLAWARRAAQHPAAGAEITEILLPLFADLVHCHSCPNNQSTMSQAVVSTAKTAALAAGNELPITVCGCSLLPGKDSPREHAKSSQIPDACNILDCYRLVSFYIFSFPHQGTLKHQSACTLPIPTEATSWIEHRQQQIPNVQTSILQHFARQQLGDSSSTILTPSGALNIPMPLVSLESHQYPAFDGPLSERSELPPFLHADLLDLMDEGAAMVFDTPNVFTDEWSEDYDTRQHPSVNVSGASASVTNAMDDERHIVPYCIGVQRVSSSHEFELDFQAVHGYKEATAISNEYAFVQRLMMGVPAALQRGGPMTLDLLRRFGWELLCEPRVSLMGLQIVPLLAVRCSLLHSLLRPAAWNCYIVSEKIHQQLLPESIEPFLRHDIALLHFALDSHLENDSADMPLESFLHLDEKINGLGANPDFAEMQTLLDAALQACTDSLGSGSDGSAPASAVDIRHRLNLSELQLQSAILSGRRGQKRQRLLLGMYDMIISIRQQLAQLQWLWQSGQLTQLMHLASSAPPASVEQHSPNASWPYPSYQPDVCERMLELGLALCQYAERVATLQAASELSKERLDKIRNRKAIIKLDIADLQASRAYAAAAAGSVSTLTELASTTAEPETSNTSDPADHKSSTMLDTSIYDIASALAIQSMSVDALGSVSGSGEQTHERPSNPALVSDSDSSSDESEVATKKKKKKKDKRKKKKGASEQNELVAADASTDSPSSPEKGRGIPVELINPINPINPKSALSLPTLSAEDAEILNSTFDDIDAHSEVAQRLLQERASLLTVTVELQSQVERAELAWRTMQAQYSMQLQGPNDPNSAPTREEGESTLLWLQNIRRRLADQRERVFRQSELAKQTRIALEDVHAALVQQTQLLQQQVVNFTNTPEGLLIKKIEHLEKKLDVDAAAAEATKARLAEELSAARASLERDRQQLAAERRAFQAKKEAAVVQSARDDEAAKARSEAAKQALADAKKQLEAARGQHQQAQKQLTALKAVEEQLAQREQLAQQRFERRLATILQHNKDDGVHDSDGSDGEQEVEKVKSKGKKGTKSKAPAVSPAPVAAASTNDLHSSWSMERVRPESDSTDVVLGFASSPFHPSRTIISGPAPTLLVPTPATAQRIKNSTEKRPPVVAAAAAAATPPAAPPATSLQAKLDSVRARCAAERAQAEAEREAEELGAAERAMSLEALEHAVLQRELELEIDRLKRNQSVLQPNQVTSLPFETERLVLLSHLDAVMREQRAIRAERAHWMAAARTVSSSGRPAK